MQIKLILPVKFFKTIRTLFPNDSIAAISTILNSIYRRTEHYTLSDYRKSIASVLKPQEKAETS